MSEARSVCSEVEVAADPVTAFAAFTEEMNLWWVRGPINFFDSARAVAKICEPGVGGRLLEVYDEAAGDTLEVGRITTWQPGERLAWQSSVDEVQIEVHFAPTARGTIVRVQATIPAGGADHGGTAWVRVVPPWFGAWCARRDSASRQPEELARLAVAIYYDRPATAARWLADVFGLRSPGVLPDDDSADHWIELRAGNCSLMVFRRDGERPEGAAPSHIPWVYVDDLQAHHDRAVAGGAAIVQGIHQHGFRAYVADDLEQNRWTFAQARPSMR